MKPYSGPVLPGPSGDPRRNSTTVQTLAGPAPVEPPKPQGRTWGEAAGDTGRGIASSTVNLAGSLAQSVNLATGGAVDRAIAPVERLARTDGTPRGVAGTTQQVSQAISRGLSADMQARQQNLSEQEGFIDSAKTVLTDPRLALQFAAEQVPILAATGKVARSSGRAGAQGAAERIAGRPKPTSERAAQRITERAAQQSAQTGIVGFTGAMGAGFAGNDAINEAMALPEDVWDANPDFLARAAEVGRDQAKQEMALGAGQRAGAVAAPLAMLAGRVAAPFEAQVFRGRLPGGTAGQLVKNIGVGAAREGVEETVSEGGERFGANVGLSSINPNQRLLEGVPEAAGTGAALGALMGGGMGGVGTFTSGPADAGREPVDPQPLVDPQQPGPQPGPEPAPIEQPQAEPVVEPQAGTVIDPASGPMSKALATAAAEERGDGVVAPTVVPDPIDVEALSAADEAMAEQVAAQEAEQEAAAVEAAKPPKPASDTEILARIRTMSDAGQIIDAGQLQFMARQFNVPLEKVRSIRQQVRQEERELAAERAAESSSTIDPPSTRNVEDVNDEVQESADAAAGLAPDSDVRGDALRGEVRPDTGPAGLSGREPGAAEDAQREAVLPAEGAPEGAGNVQGAVSEPQGVADADVVQGALGGMDGAGGARSVNRDGVDADNQPGEGAAAVSVEPGAAQAEPGAAPQPGPTDARPAVEGAAPAVAAAAAEAATSPSNATPAPTPAQLEAGNFKKGKTRINGLDYSVEYPAGVARKEGQQPLAMPYGYIRGTTSPDGEQVDAFFGPRSEDTSLPVFVLDQLDQDGNFDEHKVMLGFESEAGARAGYLSNFPEGWSGAGNIRQMTQLQFKLWVRDRKQTQKPAEKAKLNPSDGTPLPDGWDKTITKVRKLARDLGIDTEGKTREKLAAEVRAMAEASADGTQRPQGEPELGTDTAETEQIGDAFEEAAREAESDDYQVHHLFDKPAKSDIVRTNDKVKVHTAKDGWMTPAEAAAKIAEWKANAEQQGKDAREGKNRNGDKVVLSFFDMTGQWSQPWEDAGYQVYRFDIQNDPDAGDVNNFSVEFFNDWFGSFEGAEIHAILAACPCTDFAVSGARHFAAKDADGRTRASVELVHQTLRAIEYFKPAHWAIENPVGRIERLANLPPWRLSFDPNHFGDDYTKKTLLWGRFNADLPIAPTEATAGSKMHSQYGGKSQRTKNARSVTPEGFAYAFFEANNFVDNTAQSLAWKYDRLDPKAVEAAVESGMSERMIDSLVEDFYYMDLDDAAANKALRDAVSKRRSPDTVRGAPKDAKPIPAPKDGETWYHGRPAQSPPGFANDRVAFLTRDRSGADWFTDGDGTVTAHQVKVENPARMRDLQDAIEAAGLEPEGGGMLEQAIRFNSEYDGTNLTDAIYVPEVRRALRIAGFDSLLIADTLENTSHEVLVVWYPDQITDTQPSPTPPKSDKGRIVPTRMEDGSVGYRAEAIPQPAATPAPDNNTARTAWNDATPAQRRELLATAKYTDADQARALSGMEWNQLTDPVRRALSQNRPAAPEPAAKAKPAAKANTIFTEEAAAKARAIIKAKLGQLNSGFDPELLQAGITMAGYHIESGARKFSAYAKAMVADLGDSVKPFLKSWYMGVKYDPRASEWTDMDTAAAIEAADIDAVLQEDAGAQPDPTADQAAREPAEEAPAAAETDPEPAGAQPSGESGQVDFDAWFAGSKVVNPDGTPMRVFHGTRRAFDTFQVGSAQGLGTGVYFTDNREQAAEEFGSGPGGRVIEAFVSIKNPATASIAAVRNPVDGTRSEEAVENTQAWRDYDGPFKDPVDAWDEDVEFMGSVLRELGYDGIIERDSNNIEGLEILAFTPEQVRIAPVETAPQPAQTAPKEGQSDDLFSATPQGRGTGPLETAPAAAGEAAQGEGAAGQGARRGREPDAGDARPAQPERDDRRAGVAGREGGVSDSRSPAAEQRFGREPGNFVITDDVALGAGSETVKFTNNMKAIRLLKQLEAEKREATPEEQVTLATYVGWGGLPQAFPRPNGQARKGWDKRVKELREALSDEEYAAARESTTDAHYTSREVVGGIYAGLKRLGFDGGRVLEPSVGTGNFIGLAPDWMRSKTKWSAVELDSITGRIAAKLYPKARIRAGEGFQQVNVPVNYFDAAIGNPPFGSHAPFDANNKDLKGFSIHNFMFAKSIKSLKPGGVLAMVVSNQLLDKATSKQRRWFAANAKLLGAVRLPNTAFLANAGTEVTTDIIFMQKLHEGEVNPDTSWVTTGTVPDPAGGEAIPLNQYFIDNPDMMLGRMTREGKMRFKGQPALSADPGADIAAQLAQVMDKLPANVMRKPDPVKPGEANPVVELTSDVPVYGHYIADGKVHQRLPDEFGDRRDRLVVSEGKALERITGMLEIRDAMRTLMRAEMADTNDAQLKMMRGRLNQLYDKFVAKHGYLNSPTNARLLTDDPDSYRIRGLEKSYQKLDREMAEVMGVDVPKGRKTVEVAHKADILQKRVFKPERELRVESANDALAVSLNTTGRVKIDDMAAMLGSTPETVVEQLGAQVFNDPSEGWVTRDAYLSGNVKAKLAEARAAAERDPELQRNVEALEQVQPADIAASDIHVQLGSPWVPANHITRFARDQLGIEDASVSYVKALNKYVVSARSSGSERFGTRNLNAREVFTKAVNREGITVYTTVYQDGKEKRVVDGVATEQAMQVLDQMRQEFSDWVWNDAERRRDIARVYNDTFNTNVARQFDGQFLSFPGKVDDSVVKFYPSQINAIWRAVQDGRVLLDHVVGAGKTYTVIGAVMTKRRMGLSKKPMIAVPNHLVQQWANDFATLYPNANVLAVTKRDFETDRRKLLFSRIATGDWDAVIVAHSQQTAIAPPAEFEAAYIQEQIDAFDEAISAAKSEGEDNRTVKQLETAKKSFEAKKQAKVEGIKRDTDTSSFDEMGIDDLWVDEAHEFKNLSYVTRKRNVAGLGSPDGSQRAEDLFIKTRYLNKLTGGRGINFATGTPVSNSLVEMFTMQRYLAFDELKARGIESFDNWANTFAEETTEMELDSSGRGLKAKTVLKNFFNAPEMMQIYSQFADVISLDDLKRQTLAATGKPWPVPKMKGGKQQNVIIPPSPETEAYIEANIIPRAEAISGERGRKPDPSVDNMLKVTNDARLAALDIRLKIPSAPDHPNSVVNVAVGNIMRIYRANAERKGTQLVFSDLSTPKAAVASEKSALAELQRKASEGDEKAAAKLDRMSPDDIMALESDFSVYDDLKAKLIRQGIPEREIVFIHDAKTDIQKQALFNRVKSGDVRVLVGSTSKMGAGTNVQNKLVALHHLDAPWRPSDLEQREGRIIRQGNEFYKADPEGFEVEVMRYAVERTYAGRMWQLIERKAAVVDQIRRADPSMRSFEDTAGSAASAAEMKAAATGNPLIIEQVELGLTIKKLEASRKGHANRIHDAQDKLQNLQSDGGPDARHAKRTAAISKAEDYLKAHPNDPFSITLGSRTLTERADGAKAMAVAVIDAIKTRSRQGTAPIALGRYRGMDLSFDRELALDVLRAHNAELGTIARIYQSDLVKDDKVSGVGILTRLDNALTRTTQGGESSQQQLAHEKKQVAELKELTQSAFKQQGELDAAKARLKTVTDQLMAASRPQEANPDNLEVDESAQSVAEAGASKAPSGSGTIARHINRITRTWKGDAPKVVVVQNQSELPREGFSDQRVEGFYDGQGTIYLVANNLPNVGRAEQVLAHEAFGHYGVDGVVGAQQWVQVIGQVAQLRNNPPSTPVGAAIQSALRRYPSASPTTFAREVIAIMAERGLRAGFFGRVMASVRRFLTGLGINVGNWAEGDLRAIVAEGMRRVEQGPAASDAGGPRGRAFSTQEAFHGSAQRDLGRLSTDFAYTGEGNDMFGWGIYLASQKDVAEFYRKAGGAIMRKPGGALADSALTEAKGDRAEAGRILLGKKRRAKPAEVAEIDKAIAVLRMDLNRGQTYRATVPGPDVLLDWDAHYDDQPQAVREAFDAIIKSDAIDPATRAEWEATAPDRRTGRRMYSVIAVSYNTEVPGQRGASLELLKRGIPGLRYLDGQNRRPDGTANVSHNFVIFEDAAVSPLEPVFSVAEPTTQLDAIVAHAAPNDTLMNRLANKVEDWKPSTLALLTLRQLGQVVSEYLPAAKGYSDLVTKMQTRRNELADAPAKLSDRWEAMQRESRKKARREGKSVTDADLTASVMHDATIAGVDPAEAFKVGVVTLNNGEPVPLNDKASVNQTIAELKKRRAKMNNTVDNEGARRILDEDIGRLKAGLEQEALREEAYPKLKARFAQMPKAWQDLYREVRDQYSTRAEDTLKALLARINALEIDGPKRKTLADRMRARFEDARVQAPYFPLARFGDYWVSLKKGDEVRFEMAETKTARDRIIATAQREGWSAQAKGTKLDTVRSIDGASGTFVAEVNKILADNGIDKDVQDDVYQLFLRTLPELSTRKNFIHRKKTAGYSADALRAFAGNMNHSAHQLARLEYRFKLDAVIEDARKQVLEAQGEASDDADRAGRGFDELVKRHEWVKNPQHNRKVQAVISANFAFYLGLTPAAAMVNLTQTAIVTFPDLASRYGVMNALNETFKAFTQSVRTYGNFEKLAENADERRAHDELQAMGAIDRTLTHDLTGLGENDSRDYNATSRKVMKVVGHLFHKAEVINRESSGMAAYRLARKAGKSHDAAVQEASDIIWDTHFNYTNDNRARFMQGNAAKILFAFKQFSQGMTYYLGRAAFESIKGASPEVQKLARRRLIGTLGMTGVFSGVLGMPTISLVFGTLNALAAVFGDEDEPWEADVEFRNFLADMLGPAASRMIMSGPVEAITGAGISQRTSLSDLWYREPNREMEGRDLASYMLEQAAGPAIGMFMTGVKAQSTIREGLETGNSGMAWRGVEQMVPKAARDAMKALRFQTQGATSFRGDPLVEDMGLHQVLYQAIGFSPAELNTMYAANNAVKNYEQYIVRRRSALLDGYALTMRMRDTEGTAKAVQRITRFNEAHPELRITMATLRRSMLSRQRYSERAVAGIVINPNLEKVREAGRFAD